MRPLRVLWFLLPMLMAVSAASAASYLVKPDETGFYPTIWGAVVAVADGDTILLADGTFYGAGNRDISFLGKAITIRSESGDPSACIIDPVYQARAFIFDSGEGPDSRLEAVTLYRGRSTDGGLVYCDSDPSFKNVVFSQGEATYRGGGVYCTQAAPNFESCRFVGCYTSGVGGGAGGGIYANSSDLAMTSTVLQGCTAEGGGGGLAALNSVVSLDGCTLSSCNGYPKGGAIHSKASTITAVSSFFVANEADSGGAIYFRNDIGSSIVGCKFQDQHAIRGSAVLCRNASILVEGCLLIKGNGYGSLYCMDYSYPSINQSTISHSVSSTGTASGINAYTFSAPVITNSIIAFGSGGQAVRCDPYSSATLSCCDVFGNEGGDWFGCIVGQAGLNGNISADPQFCDTLTGDYTLEGSSPCLDATGCGQIGAYGYGCGISTGVASARIVDTNWGAVKKLFR